MKKGSLWFVLEQIRLGDEVNLPGRVSGTFVESAIDSIAGNMNGYKVIVTKSTVPVGTNRWIHDTIAQRSESSNFEVVSNPEFLREGSAVHDVFHPDRVVIGYESERAKEIVQDIYKALYIIETPFLFCNFETAELIKYASNAFLATKITFINQVANLCEAVGADVHKVAKGMGTDQPQVPPPRTRLWRKLFPQRYPGLCGYRKTCGCGYVPGGRSDRFKRETENAHGG